MAGNAILASNPGIIVSPAIPQTDLAVAANFERFDGLMPMDHPGTAEGDIRGFTTGEGFSMSPRPGQMGQPLGQVYTQGPLSATVGTVGGQPLPVSPRIYKDTGQYTPSKWPTIQGRLGVGQHGPSGLGVAQTVALSEITNNPPVPGDLTSILAGLG